jgi:O-antigen ligase
MSWRALAAPLLLGVALMFAPGFLFTRMQQAETSGGAGRLYIWQTGLSALKDYFLTGAGLDNFSVIYNDYAAHAAHFAGLNRPPHNIFLGIAVESGVLGLLLIAIVIFSHFRYASRCERLLTGATRFRLIACEAAACAMLASSFFLHLIWTKEFWIVWVMLAICSRVPRVDFSNVAQISDEVKVDHDATREGAELVANTARA